METYFSNTSLYLALSAEQFFVVYQEIFNLLCVLYPFRKAVGRKQLVMIINQLLSLCFTTMIHPEIFTWVAV